jgi:hypothetical protein
MEAKPGDMVIRTYDGKIGEVELESKAHGWLWVRFTDGTCVPVFTEFLRVLDRSIDVVLS